MPIGRIADLAYPITPKQFRDEANVSCDDNPAQSLLLAHGYTQVEATAPPAIREDQRLVGPTMALVGSDYLEVWGVRNMTADERAFAADAMAARSEEARLRRTVAEMQAKGDRVGAIEFMIKKGLI